MPCNEYSFKAFCLCVGALKRIMIPEGKGQKFMAYAPDTTEIYHLLKGYGMFDCETFADVVSCVRYCLKHEVLK